MKDIPFKYLIGFGATHQSEAISGALPLDQNSPRTPPHGLYAEQINGTPFTVGRSTNLRTWVYRVRPSVVHGELEPVPTDRFRAHLAQLPNPNLHAWGPAPFPDHPIDFLDGLQALCGAGDPADGPGFALHRFVATRNMVDRAFSSADGDLMILPDTGVIHVQTELGWLHVEARQLAVIPRGMLFSVHLPAGSARGVVMEIYQRHFALPERGVIGANGLADARHFQIPVAAYEDRAANCEVLVKMGGRLFRATRDTSPFDVVAWHGSYTPYRYEFRHFNAMGTVTWDHPDPCLYTVMTAPLHHPGQSLADLVVFPNPRWDVANNTFRPPYYHRNAAAELNLLVGGPSRPGDAMSCGGVYITPPFTAHGPSSATTERARAMDDTRANAPQRLASDTTWLQFESALQVRVAGDAWAETIADFRGFASDVPSRFDAG